MFLLLLLNACSSFEKYFVNRPINSQNYTLNEIHDNSIKEEQKIIIKKEKIEDEEIEGFVLQEGENPFNSESSNSSKHELFTEDVEPAPLGDRYKDSAHYGLQTIYFNFNEKNIKDDQLSKVEHNLKVVQNLVKKGYDIVIEGHACDSAGSPCYNLILSEDRAKCISEYFVSHGIKKDNITIVGRGSEIKIVPFGNKEQQAPNRRVEIFAYAKK